MRLDRGYISQRPALARAGAGHRGARAPPRARCPTRLRTRRVTQERFTSLDRELERRAQDNRRRGPLRGPGRAHRRVHARRPSPAPRRAPARRARLAHVVETRRGLAAAAARARRARRHPQADPRRHLRATRRATASFARARPCRPTRAGGRRFVSGRVASKGLSDELKGTFYAVVETPTGRAYHVPLDARAGRDGASGRHRVVRDQARGARPSGRSSRSPRGRSRPRRRLHARARPRRRRTPARASVGCANSSACGLASPEGAGDRWKVAPDLLEELAERQREARRLATDCSFARSRSRSKPRSAIRAPSGSIASRPTPWPPTASVRS